MSFSENLQTLRKAAGISQEQLAERLDVSRQAVSKWETDGGYPEIDKIIALCDLFGCTMDELVKGSVSSDKNDERRRYDSHFNRYSKLISVGVMLVIQGVALSTLFFGLADSAPFKGEFPNIIGTAAMFLFIAASVPLFIAGGLEHSDFEKRHPIVPQIYSADEIERYNTRVFPYLIGGGIALILIGLVLTVIPSLYIWSAAAFLGLTGIAAAMMTYACLQHSKYDIDSYNRDHDEDDAPDSTADPLAAARKKRRALIRKINGTIMLSATALFLAIGFIWDIWDPSWAVFPLGGIACAIVSVLLKIPDDKE